MPIPGWPTSEFVQEVIPAWVLEVLVNSGAMPRPDEPPEDQGVNFGEYYVRPSFKASFVASLANAMTEILEDAKKNDEDKDAKRKREGMWSVLFTYVASDALAARGIALDPATAPKKAVGGLGRQRIDEYFRLSKDIHQHFQFAWKASPVRRKIDGGTVTAVHISRIYNDRGGPVAVRQAVAEVLSERVPCERDDLLPSSNQPDVKQNETD